METLWILLAGGYFIVLPVIAIVALSRTTRLREDIERLKAHVEFLKRRKNKKSEEDTADKPLAATEDGHETQETKTPSIEPVNPVMAANAEVEEPITSAPPPPPFNKNTRGSAQEQKPANNIGLEETLTSRWMVWLGGIALALGGGFLVKYSIDQGYFGPGVRIAFGVMAAIAMVITGEWLRRRDAGKELPIALPNYVPAALVAAGIFTAFATIYSAYALYDMLPSLAAFILLAMVAFAGMAFSIIYGEFLAALGLIGALTVPALVSTDSPNVWTLFLYLTVVSIGAASLVRYRDWWRIGLAVLIGAIVWPLLWIIGSWHMGDSLPISLFVIGLTGLFLFWLYPAARMRTEKESMPVKWFDYVYFPNHVKLTLLSIPGTALILLVLTRLDHYSTVNLVLAAIFACVLGWAAWRYKILEQLYAWSALFALVMLGMWHLPNVIPTDIDSALYGSLVRAPIVPPAFSAFVTAVIGFGLISGVSGFLAVRRAARPGYWAAVSAITILMLLILAYWRIGNFTPTLNWGLVGLVIALILLSAAAAIANTDTGKTEVRSGLAAYAVATIAAIALAFAMTLEEAWLTVALALILPAAGWVWQKLKVPGLLITAQILAGIVIARLVLNPFILDYEIGGFLPGFSWVLYGYGIPAAAFYLARLQFGKDTRASLTDILDAGALAFTVFLVSLEIRVFTSNTGTLSDSYGLFEQGLQTLSWMAFAYILLILEGRQQRLIYRWGRIGLTVLAGINLLIFEGFADFPLFNRSVNVGTLPIFNSLLIAYALPGLACIALYKAAKKLGDMQYAQLYGYAMLVLTFVWLNLEIRHWFQGPVIALIEGRGIDNAESYAYSAIWLIYAGFLLAVAFWRNIAVLRYASLAILLLAVAKVFLIDMSTLEGLWRAISFLGLGGALIGVGYFYQSYVFAKPKEED